MKNKKGFLGTKNELLIRDTISGLKLNLNSRKEGSEESKKLKREISLWGKKLYKEKKEGKRRMKLYSNE